MANNPTRTFTLQKNDGAGNFSDVTATSIATSTGTSSASSYTLSGISYGQYKATFTVQDASGNQSQKVSFFSIDNPSISLSTQSIAIGNLLPNTLTTAPTTVTLTVRTIGTPFALTLGNANTLDT